MGKAAKRRGARQAAKRRLVAPQAIGENPVEQGPELLRRGERESVEGPLEDFPDDEHAWLLEREAEDIQRGDR
jgi:hypothetical protein